MNIPERTERKIISTVAKRFPYRVALFSDPEEDNTWLVTLYGVPDHSVKTVRHSLWEFLTNELPAYETFKLAPSVVSESDTVKFFIKGEVL